MSSAGRSTIDAVRRVAQPLAGHASDYDSLLTEIDDARIVLIGEASHGTEEFYRERAVITRRLIVEKGFHAVAVEADFPDANRVNRHVNGGDEDRTAVDALGAFRRFPGWMWRNTDVLGFVHWLRGHNARGSTARRCGFYGLDLYSLHSSMQAVLAHLSRVDPLAARRARQRYSCFDHYGEDAHAYGYSAATDLDRSCEDQVVAQLVELRATASSGARSHGDPDKHFIAEQNARVVRNAEAYYRTMFRGRATSWNLRDRHIMETFAALASHRSGRLCPAKIVVWAHNSHLGDARATEMSARGEINLGQLLRERYGDAVYSIGFSTATGTVTAASDWDAPATRMRVRAPLLGSYEALMHDVGIDAFLLDLRGAASRIPALQGPRLQRAIGVVYRPDSERLSHYFHARLPRQFDTMIHIDRTRAVVPLDTTEHWTAEMPETYPSGL
jgi:erythromycin esterase-like protein